MLKVARMMVEVRIDLAAAKRNSLNSICWVADWLAADWNRPFPDTLIFLCGPPKFTSARDSNHPPRPPSSSGDMRLVVR